MNGNRWRWWGWGILVAALAVNLAAGIAYGLKRPMESDQYYFIQIAQSLAKGTGYVVHDGFWPDEPTLSRLPGWPFAVSLALRVVPGVADDLVMRILCLMVNAGVAWGLFALTRRLFGRVGAAVLAAAAYLFHPTALYLACTGTSEPLFLLLAGWGSVLLLGAGWKRLAGCLLLGCACLVRAHFVLWFPFAMVLAGAWMAIVVRRRPTRRELVSMALGGLLFALPTAGWVLRNAKVSGHFPVVSTLKGQTFYGGNNAIVSDTLEYWGYWIFPDGIPGEKTMLELSRTMSEVEVDRYYTGKGKHYLREHWLSAPRLLLGKLVRAFVPVPWKPSLGAYAVALVRIVLGLGALVGLVLGWRRIPAAFGVNLAATTVTALVMVLMFWGCARFAFTLEPFFFPLFGLAGSMLSGGLARKGEVRGRISRGGAGAQR